MTRYSNPHLSNDRRSVWDVILWKTGHYDDSVVSQIPPNFVYPSKAKPYDRNLPSAVWIGHSTFLVNCKGFTVLTDPAWDDYCFPIPFRSLKRLNMTPFPLEDLPKIDAVLLSHNHRDHLNAKTIQKLFELQPQILWIVPKGLARWFRSHGIAPVVELGWWQSYGPITAVPAQHFSGRTLWDKNKTLWNGYVLEVGQKKLYFVGDTGYNPIDFKEIGKAFAPIDLSLIPIGTYVPREFMAPVHCSPFDAVQIHQDVGSKFSLGMHWNTFCLSDEPINRPPYDLFLAMQAKNLPFDTFLPVDIGVHVNW